MNELITSKLSLMEPPLNNIFNQDEENTDMLNDLILKNINYTKTTEEIFGESITLRSVNYVPEKPKNLFSEIADDCCEVDDVLNETEKIKINYAKNFLEQKSCDPPSSEDENIDNLISNIENQIYNINRKTSKIRTLWQARWSQIQGNFRELIDHDDFETIQKFTEYLNTFRDDENHTF
jgi:hypothetical protein